MQLCINPSCPLTDNPDNDNNRFCKGCGSNLLLQGRYRVMRLSRDRSGFGKIYEADERGMPKILKVLKENLNGDAKAVELFQQEATVLGQLPLAGIPKVDGYFQFQTRNGLSLHCIVMEKIDGPNLEQWLIQQRNHPSSQDRAIAWLKQLFEILQLVHSKHYLHRDIKPSNIMLKPNGQLVLIDFGTANTQEILQRLEEIDRELTETINVVGSPKTQPLPPQGTKHYNLPLAAIVVLLLVALGLIALTALAVLNPELTLLPTPTQSPQRKGDVDYFPYQEGRDSEGRTAEFNIAVLSIEYKWQIGSSYQIKYNDRLISLDSLKSSIEEEGIRRIMENPSEIISVGTASCEGSPQQEERRAFERAKQIQLLVKKLFRTLPSVQGYRLLIFGQFRRDGCQSNQDLTSYQRSIIIIGVRNQTEGVILDEALRERLEKKPFGDFKLEDYSLGGKENFQTIPSRL